MKFALAVPCLFAVLYWSPFQTADEPATKAETVRVVRGAEVFKNHPGFIDRRAALKEKIESAEAEIKRLYEELKKAEATAKVTQGQDKQAAEEQAKKLKAEMDEFRRTHQAKYLEMERTIYQDVTLDVQNAIKKLAQEKGYTLVLFVHSERPDLPDVKTATSAELGRFPRLAYIENRDRVDITDEVLAAIKNQDNF